MAKQEPDLSNVDYLRALRRANEETSASVSSIPLHASGTEHTDSSKPGRERRAAPRYQCTGSAELRTTGSDFRTWASVTDVSKTGCYLEVQATSPPDTPVEMVIEVVGVRLRANGKVRVTYPFLGMGIAFTDLSPEDRANLEEMLQRLSTSSTRVSGAPNKVAEPMAASTQIVAIANPAAALNAVVQFFQSNSSLRKEEFLQLLRRSQEAPAIDRGEKDFAH